MLQLLSERYHYYYYLLIYLFVLTLDELDWVLEGEEGLCDLVASSGFSKKNSQSKAAPQGGFLLSTKKNNLLTVHIRLALFFHGTLSLNVWRTKERGGGGGGVRSAPHVPLVRSLSFLLTGDSVDAVDPLLLPPPQPAPGSYCFSG